MATNLLVGSDNVIELSELTDEVTGSYLTGATVVCTLYLGGDAVAGASNIAMSYVAATNATYRGNIEDTVPLLYGNTYTARVTVTNGALVQTLTISCPTVRS